MDYIFHMPKTLQDALEILNQSKEEIKILAGGTDLMLDLHKKKYQPKAIVDLSGIPELQGIRVEGDIVHIGSMTTFTAIANSPLLQEHVAVLAEAASVVGSPQIRNQGTIGGNLANASPAADTVPPLVALNAVAVVASLNEVKEVPVTEISAGVGKNNLLPDQVITEIKFTLPSKGCKSVFVKFGRRNALAIARMSLALMVRVEEGIIQDARVALGAVAPSAFRATEIENFLNGNAPSSELFEEALAIASKVVSDKLQNRPSAKWKNPAIKGLLRQALEKLQLV